MYFLCIRWDYVLALVRVHYTHTGARRRINGNVRRTDVFRMPYLCPFSRQLFSEWNGMCAKSHAYDGDDEENRRRMYWCEVRCLHGSMPNDGSAAEFRW